MRCFEKVKESNVPSVNVQHFATLRGILAKMLPCSSLYILVPRTKPCRSKLFSASSLTFELKKVQRERWFYPRRFKPYGTAVLVQVVMLVDGGKQLSAKVKMVLPLLVTKVCQKWYLFF